MRMAASGPSSSDEPSVTMSRAKRLPLSGEARAAQEDILAVVTGLEAQMRSDHKKLSNRVAQRTPRRECP